MPPPVLATAHRAQGSLSLPRKISDQAASDAADVAARGWFLLAIGSLVLAGLLSLTLVIGRAPFLGRLFSDPLFFRRALIVHVDLAIVVWFQAGTLAALGQALGPSLSRTWSRLTQGLAGAGVATLLAGALVPGAQPVLNNYVPVIDHPLFFVGLACWFAGAGGFFLQALFAPARSDRSAWPSDAVIAFRAAAAANLLALATFVAAWRTNPPAPAAAYYELLFWGGGHVLQAANVAAMLGLWLYLGHRLTGRQVLGSTVAASLLGALILPQLVMPPLALTGTVGTAYFTMATHLMRWTLFPVTVVVLALAVRHLTRHWPDAGWRDYRLVGFAGSATLILLGFLLGALIRGSSTLVPGHYHCAIGAVTIALMTAAYELSSRSVGAVTASSPWARLQLLLFGVGQAVFGLGFALAGAYGLGRKQYGVEQHVRTAGEYFGLSVMGLGGLVAVAGGILFLVVMVRRIATWRRLAAPTPAFSHE